ncbi:MAG: FAD-dependent oxidoreductase [Dokdonella sp.]
MTTSDALPPGPDFAQGVAFESIPVSGILAGHVDGSAVLLSRLHDGVFAVSGTCTHYGAPLAEGLVVDGEVRCPWHHACFSLRTGHALRAPAFAALKAWRVEVVGERVFVRAELDAAPTPSPTHPRVNPDRIVIVGGGAAGFAAAERLRSLGFSGALSMLSADPAPPCDRPNLSKDYLAGTASEDWIPLQPAQFYPDRRIDLQLGCEVAHIDTAQREVRTLSGERFAYDALLIATGAEPVRLSLSGFDLPNVFTLRSLADANAIIHAAVGAKSAALVGAGFIGLEVANSLRQRGLDVHVIARDSVPMEKVLGRELGDFITGLHREHGVAFHLQRVPTQFDGRLLTLDDGTTIAADILIVGVGVKPRAQIAVEAGLAVDNGVLVDAHLQTSVPGVYAAGDVANFPYGADRVRIEHWVHAERQGQCVAANMLGDRQAFGDVPFFWSHHYDFDIRYAGHAVGWDDVRIEGSLAARDCVARYFRNGILLAAASIGRDRENLAIEAELRKI